MKRFRRWLNWWMVTLSFVLFLAAEALVLYCWFWFLQLL